MQRNFLRRAAALALSCLLLTAAVGAKPRLSMSYLYYTGGDVNAVEQAGNALNEVSPGWFELNADGTLKVSTSASAAFVRQMHDRGIRVTPFLSNHWDRELGAAALENSDRLVEQLLQAVERYDLDGVSLDLENMTAQHAQPYVDMVRSLRRSLPEGKTIAVAVAANPRNFTTGWHASYDYAGLSEWADYLMVMAYDEHYRGSEPGAVASRSFVEGAIRYALRHAPAEKIVLGIPFYGRIWNDAGGTVNGIGIRETQIQTLLAQYGGAVTYDEDQHTAVAKFTVPEGGTAPTVAGVALTPGEYTIFYTNERAKKELLTLVDDYDLLGAGSWSLGQETADTWSYYGLWLNGARFSDVQGHWSRDYVAEAYASGWMRGTAEGTFTPNRTLTRAEAAALLVRMTGIEADKTAAGFSDTRDHWARGEIAAAAEAGLVEGVGDGRFAPDAPVTREQMAALLYRAAGYLGADSSARASLSSFADGGSVGAYARDAVSWAVAEGLLKGDGGKLLPRSGTSRAQIAALLCRFADAVF